MKTVHLTEQDMQKLFDDLAVIIQHNTHHKEQGRRPTIYGIPRGGVPVAYRLAGMLSFSLADSLQTADILVDDLVCTGRTRENALKNGKHDVEFYSLINAPEDTNGIWYVFPWEGTETASADDIPVRLLEFIGEDPKRDGLLGTPERFLKAWKFFTHGYEMNASTILSKTFEKERYNEMVVLRDIEFYSTCEHHLVPFFGKVHIAYIPSDKVVGISKLARVVECFSRRLQIQERLTEQIATAIDENLRPKGVAVLIEAQHLCMVSRGVEKQNSVMVTSALKGVLEEQSARMEFLLLKR